MVILLKSNEGGVCDNDEDGELLLDMDSCSSLSRRWKCLLHRPKSFTLQLIRLMRTSWTRALTVVSRNSFSLPQKYHSFSLFSWSRLLFMINAENLPLNFLNAINWMSDHPAAFMKEYSLHMRFSTASFTADDTVASGIFLTLSTLSSTAHSETTANKHYIILHQSYLQ